VIYPSYFSMVRLGFTPFDTNYGLSLRRYVDGYGKAETIENLGLFGRPVEAGLIEVKCTNRLLLTKIKYEKGFGAGFLGARLGTGALRSAKGQQLTQ
jgi:hypothetical protein